MWFGISVFGAKPAVDHRPRTSFDWIPWSSVSFHIRLFLHSTLRTPTIARAIYTNGFKYRRLRPRTEIPVAQVGAICRAMLTAATPSAFQRLQCRWLRAQEATKPSPGWWA
jgi:hypothetical protein